MLKMVKISLFKIINSQTILLNTTKSDQNPTLFQIEKDKTLPIFEDGQKRENSYFFRSKWSKLCLEAIKNGRRHTFLDENGRNSV